jgi:heme oxygenase (biliverdin-producing, ferredoxin)
MSVAEAQEPRPLSAALREGTRQAHRMAESMRFVRSFLRGTVDEKSYVRLLVAHEHVYAALEGALERCAEHPSVAPLRLHGLARGAALLADRAFFAARAGAKIEVEPGPAARRYALRIQEVAKHRPELLPAHAYVRYLGDLSGGQVLGAIARRTLGLAEGEGTAFYEFGSAETRLELKRRFRAGLDERALPPAEQAALVAEAVAVFGYNMEVFAELEGSAWQSFLRLLFPRHRVSRGKKPRSLFKTTPPAPHPAEPLRETAHTAPASRPTYPRNIPDHTVPSRHHASPPGAPAASRSSSLSLSS